MKPLVYFDFQKYENDGNFVIIDKERLKEILEEVYESGYKDGQQKNSVIPYFNQLRQDNTISTVNKKF